MIIIINNKKYDITEFINEHPGGNNVFVDGKDMTEEFNKVGHSKQAVKMLEKYLIKEEEVEELKEIKEEEVEIKEVKVEEEIFDKISIYDLIKYKWNNNKISKLFTHEDYLNLHKILGVIVLINFCYFVFDLAYSGCKGKCTIRKINLSFFVILIIHLLLSLSSLQFKIQKNITYTTISLNDEIRMQSILFSIRHLLVILILYFFDKNILSHLLTSFVVLLNMYLADLNTYYNKPKNTQFSLINSIGFWSTCSNELKMSITNIYTLVQIFGTYMLITSKSNIELNYIGIFIIQITAFMTTLSKKGIINNFQWHFIYLFQYLLFFILFFNNRSIFTFENLFISILLWICRTRLSVNKFFLWSVVSIIYLFNNYVKNNTLLFGVLILLYFGFNHYNIVMDKKREYNHHFIKSNINITDTSLHKIKIKLKESLKYHPGQYINLYIDKEKKPYTPIEFNKEENIITFFIKNYKNNKISEKICLLKEKICIHVDGPFGNNYYEKEKDVLIYHNKPIEHTNILMFYCGTGITPFYSILTNLQTNSKYNCKIFGSLRNEKENCLDIKQKIFYSDNKLTIKKINKILKKFDPNNTTILVCGNENYNNLFLDVNNFTICNW
jgi:NAD(P)H-flavin reductase